MIQASKLFSNRSTTFSSCRLLSSLRNSYDHIIASKEMPPSGDDLPLNNLGVGVITLNRPKALNALCDALFEDLIHAATAFNEDDQVGSIIITGKGKAFAAGADIEEMSKRQFDFAYKTVSKTLKGGYFAMYLLSLASLYQSLIFSLFHPFYHIEYV